MYQSVIRDPGGSSLIRIQANLCDEHRAIVNGSRLIVPAGTVAFVVINGILSAPYRSGEYRLFTGTDPFMVRLRNILTHGDAGTTVSVYFISTEKNKFEKFGTGDFIFHNRRFGIDLRGYASCAMRYSIKDPLVFLDKIVGSYNSEMTEEDIQPCIEQVILAPVKEAVSIAVGRLEIAEYNSNLTRISNSVMPRLRTDLSQLGISLNSFSITSINVPEKELSRLGELQLEYARGKTKTDLELDHLNRVWDRNINKRTLSEMLTGFTSRGPNNNGNTAQSSRGGSGDMLPMMMQMMIASQMLPALREPINEMTRHTDLFRGNQNNPQQNTSSADAPPPIPSRYKRCPSCNEQVLQRNNACPVCGYRFN